MNIVKRNGRTYYLCTNCGRKFNHLHKVDDHRCKYGMIKMARNYYTLAVWPKAEGQQWSPQFGDYDREVVAQELEDTKADWPKGSKFKIVKSGDKQIDINVAIDALNRKSLG